MIKTREFPESNYRGIHFNGKTLRVALDPSKPITELEYPEFYDVKITSHCKGECPWCYMDSTPDEEHPTVLQKIYDFFGNMTENERPFQVAIGGGEPTGHPGFVEILRTFDHLGITPNYTTNGMWCDTSSDYKVMNIIDGTMDYCGGVAVSCHPHLKKYWEEAAHLYDFYSIKMNFHLIISDRESIEDFLNIFTKWEKIVDYFVLLPYGNQGRAEHKEIDWEFLVKVLPISTKLAFGANFYPYLLRDDHDIEVSLYEPEIMSKFLDLKDMSLHNSSFDL